ncbi:unnamed protein product, partial [Tetraodon nigroviridis]
AVHAAGSVPCRGGGRDGREAGPPVVGGLADAGPRPAQPGGGGPGESGRTRQKTPKKETTDTGKWLITFEKYF